MRQLTFIEPGKFEWHDVPAPRISSDTDAIVRPLTVARCDLDFYIARGIARHRGPFAFGHETIGEVVEAGPAVPFRPGERVAVPFQLSCGRCANCQRGFTNSCSSFPFGAAYGLKATSGTEFGGALSDLIYVPFADHMLLPLPAGVDPIVAASAPDNIADGWRAVQPHLQARPGGSVLVVGGGENSDGLGAMSVGLYAAGAAVALMAGEVLYLDDDENRRQRARLMGATVDRLALAEGRSAERQFDIVVLALGSDAALQFAIQSTGPNGVLTSVTIFLDRTNAVPLTRAYTKGLTFLTGRVNSRSVLPGVLACIACGAFHPEHVTSRTFTFDQAADAMTEAGPKFVFCRQLR
ncbi:zinc-dependent alcohol dehydrogenase [Bradyrhizobium guangdongense]|uniref:zinc-dependent alcohol dehydrogenase n=1 Tax=Bradyrhizobium guangdongense TaxID=1325090 RepID=UPI0016431B57|nr:alcohol dehydrogenase catalytic domain-containing protein [Bradyrhizobium guangdongense]